MTIQDIVNSKERQNIFPIVLEEACRQWYYDFINRDPEYKDAHGFAVFFFKTFSEKEEEYLEQIRNINQ